MNVNVFRLVMFCLFIVRRNGFNLYFENIWFFVESDALSKQTLYERCSNLTAHDLWLKKNAE